MDNTRPLFFSFEKETPEKTKEVLDRIEQELSTDVSFEICQSGLTYSFNINIDYEITMVD